MTRGTTQLSQIQSLFYFKCTIQVVCDLVIEFDQRDKPSGSERPPIVASTPCQLSDVEVIADKEFSGIRCLDASSTGDVKKNPLFKALEEGLAASWDKFGEKLNKIEMKLAQARVPQGKMRPAAAIAALELEEDFTFPACLKVKPSNLALVRLCEEGFVHYTLVILYYK